MELGILGFETDFETDSGNNFLILSKEGLSNNEIIGFQVEMIAKNKIPGVLGLNIREKDLEIKLWYDVTGLATLANFLKRQKVSKNDFISILKNITTTLTDCKNYLLNDRFFILDENMIYINPGSLQTYLVYIPFNRTTEITETFRRFILNLIINTANIDTIDNFVQILLCEIKKDDFCLEGLRRNLDKMRRDNKLTEDTNLTLINNTNTSFSTKQSFVLQSDTSITAKDQDFKKPTSPVKATASGNGFYVVMIIASIVVLLVVGLNTYLLNPAFLSGINMAPVSIMVFALALAGVLGLGAYLKSKNNSNHIERGREGSACQLDESNDICLNNFSDIRDGTGWFHEQNLSKSSLSPEDCPVKSYTDETVLLHIEKQSPRLVAVNGGQTIVIYKPEFIVGRNRETCDYAIEHKSVGRAHASIKCENEKYYLVDLDSRNGTYINGTRLISNKHYELTENDVVVFANTGFHFKNG